MPWLKQTTTLVLVCLALTSAGCRPAPVDDPTREVQARIAARLADPGCLAGGSAEVQAWVNAADADGIVRLPAGCFQITTPIGVPAGRRVYGAGLDQTILYRDPELARDRDTPILTVFGRSDQLTQVSGIAFVGVRDTKDTAQDYGLRLSNNASFRIDHCYFEGLGFAGVRVDGNSRGVIDHSMFVDNYKQGIDNLGYGVVVYGSGVWAEDPRAGTDQAVFIEDSVFSGNRHSVAASSGSHYVFRHNHVLRNVEACSVDAHGPGYGSTHGTRYVEIYDNVIEASVHAECGIGIRGGDGVIFRNTLRGFRAPILLILEWGTPESQKASYPALDQIRELWLWDNATPSGAVVPLLDAEAKGFIRAGRDYFATAKPGYEPYPYPHPLTAGGPFD